MAELIPAWPGSHCVDCCCADRGNHQPKAKTGRDCTDSDLIPVDVDRPAAHQVETGCRKEQPQYTGKAAGNAATQPPPEQRSQGNHGRKTQQRESAVKHRALQNGIDKDGNVGHRNDQRGPHKKAHQ